MPRPASQQSPELSYRARVITWAAMLFSIAMYAALVKFSHPNASTGDPTMPLLLAAVALVAASFGVKGYFFKRARDAGSPALIRTGEFIAMNLCEAAALLGVVAWFLAASPQYYWFLILGAIGQLLHYPRREW